MTTFRASTSQKKLFNLVTLPISTLITNYYFVYSLSLHKFSKRDTVNKQAALFLLQWFAVKLLRDFWNIE